MTEHSLTTPSLTTTSLNTKERGQWFLHQVAGKSGIGNLGISCQFTHELRWWPTQEALRVLGERHSTLRQRFPASGGIPVRETVLPEDFAVPLEVTGGTEDDLDELLAKVAARPFDLTTGPLIQATHIMLASGSVLLIVAHHLVVDGASMSVLADEFVRLYHYLAEGDDTPPELSAPVPVFRENAPDQARMHQWAERLTGADAADMMLYGAKPLTRSPTFACDLVDAPLPEGLRRQLSELRASLRVSDSMLILAASAVLLHLHGAGERLVVGVPVNLRRGQEAANAVGFHVSTVPVPFDLGAGTTFRDVVAQARSAMLEILSGPPVSFEDILEHLGHRSADWRAPLFRHVVNLYQPVPVSDRPDVRQVRIHRAGCRTDLELTTGLGGVAKSIQAWFSTEVHDRAEVLAMLRRFAPLIEAVWAEPDTALADLDISSPEDLRAVAGANATATDLKPLTLVDLVAKAAPDRIALVDGDRAWTYRDLHRIGAHTAERLKELGVARGQRVGVVGVRGVRLAAAVLGIWASGAAYIPLDPDLPSARASDLLEGAAGVVVPEGPWTVLEAGKHTPFVMTVEIPGLDSVPDLESIARPEDAAVVVYTSGSTGRPKGVVVGHTAMVNVMCDFADRLEVTPEDRMLWSTTFSFDVSALELFVSLVRGATVVAVDDATRRRPTDLLAFIAREQVGLAQATPTLWRELAPVADGELAGLRVICGGEPLTAALARQLLAAGCRLFNAYGPTETTIWSTAAEIQEPVPEVISVGRPIANTVVDVRDDDGRPCTPGSVGELWIGGSGLAAGYLGQAELTAERFAGEGAERRYRTGDRARWGADGSLILHGRADRQVKLRGHRIELGEVEAILEQHPRVRAAAVSLVFGPQKDTILAAFVQPSTLTGEDSGLPDELWRYLHERLPAYEVPGRIIPTSAFPTTPNGKVDYRRLGEVMPAAAMAPAEAVEPDDPLLRMLLGIWRDLLGAPGLGAGANFFLNGGHSLLAAQLLTEVEARSGCSADWATLFAAPTPEQFADRLRATEPRD